LETLEQVTNFGEGIHYHIQYALYWGNEIDLAIIMVQGTTEELWEKNSHIFQNMKDFEVIDMSRFDE